MNPEHRLIAVPSERGPRGTALRRELTVKVPAMGAARLITTPSPINRTSRIAIGTGRLDKRS